MTSRNIWYELYEYCIKLFKYYSEASFFNAVSSESVELVPLAFYFMKYVLKRKQ